MGDPVPAAIGWLNWEETDLRARQELSDTSPLKRVEFGLVGPIDGEEFVLGLRLRPRFS